MSAINFHSFIINVITKQQFIRDLYQRVKIEKLLNEINQMRKIIT